MSAELGKYKPYLEYKHSGGPRLGLIPIHWKPKKLKLMASIENGRDYKHIETDEGYPVIGSGGQFTWASKHLFNGESILLGRKGTIDKPLYINGPFWTVDTMFYTKISPNVIAKYLFYAALTIEFNRYSTNTALPSMTQEDLGNIHFAEPSFNEMQIIASFLDYETARIDRLIAKQQQLIELLKEKQQAVISHVVTKGLNPDVQMKDSGVEWLGQVPEHWVVTKFGFISSVVRGGSPRPAGDPSLFNGDYSPWVTVAEITKDDELYLTETESFLTEKGSKQCRVFSSGTLLLSNSGATLGVPKILTMDANANDGVVGFENLTIDNRFAYFYLSTLTENLRDRIKQGSGQPNLNTDIVKDLAIAIPPHDEVVAIICHLLREKDKFSLLIAKSYEFMNILIEKRTALISAAVTGKIDLREWVEPVYIS